MLISNVLIALLRLLVGASPRWMGTMPAARQRIYFANHSSHMDTLMIWSALPPDLRKTTRPVAASDYWNKGRVRRYLASNVLNAVFIIRDKSNPGSDPLEPLIDALEQGSSLIIFPEGTRGKDRVPGPFKSGLYHLAMRFPEVELIPVYLENLNRSMPKGTYLPVPLICTVRFGAPLNLIANETKQEFLERARQKIMELT
jgi:1-acyl-sn-glycerol-3-phosphate acyltransferase